MGKLWIRGKLAVFVGVTQSIFVLMFAVLVQYGSSIEETDPDGRKQYKLHKFYPMFQDVHVMIVLGIAYLLTFLKRYGYSAVGFNLLIFVFVAQWSTLVSGLLNLVNNKIPITIQSLLGADFSCATVLISFCVVLGKTNPIQLMVFALIETVVYHVNMYIALTHFQTVDVGLSVLLHVFAAYFGLAVTRVIYDPRVQESQVQQKEESLYHSDLFSIFGTIFLWMFWPSFNAAEAVTPDARHRAVINTYYSLCACALVTFALSIAVDNKAKFKMEHMQNCTIAGGVAIGAVADMMIQPYIALIIGALAATVCVLGFKYLKPQVLGFHDTCGVHNLHALPGLIGGIAGIIVAAIATHDTYGKSLYVLFPARAPGNETAIVLNRDMYGYATPGDDRSAGTQAGYQAATIALTLAMAITGGTITGFILKLPVWDMPDADHYFEDKLYWHIPEEGYCKAKENVVHRDSIEQDHYMYVAESLEETPSSYDLDAKNNLE